LLYELIYLSISFHPAATLVKRRIRETRELACDEYVTDTMVEPAVYARSLVSIAGLAMDLGRGANITIGIMDDGDLEKRIMKILNRPKINLSRKSLLVSSASLVFALAIIAPLAFTLRPVIAQQQPNNTETARKKLVEAKKMAEDDNRRQEESDIQNPDLARLKDLTFLTRQDEKQRAERESEILNRLELTNPPTITMADAINIATGQQPGTVVESRLVFERNGGETEEPFYVIKVAFDQNGLKAEKNVIVSGSDGSVGGPKNN
ncbi:MAG: hypothetical protein ACRD43_15640, partial [Pyrinomonadaceae bacterium]